MTVSINLSVRTGALSRYFHSYSVI